MMVDPTKELEASVRRVEQEVKELLVERERLERSRQDLDERIGKRMNYLRATEDLLRDLRPEGSPPAQPRRLDISSSAGAKLSQVVALHAIARTGYGAATKGVLAMMASSPDGCGAREMIDAIREGGFDVRDADTAVRSALKNLRKQGKVRHNGRSGKYQLTEMGRQSVESSTH